MAALKRGLGLIEATVSRFAADLRDYRAGEHRDALREFQREWFGEQSRQQDERVAHWLYSERADNHLCYCVRDGVIAGTQGALGFDLCVDGRNLKGVCAIDLRVRPEWKLKGLGAALIGTLLLRYDVVIGLGVSEEAARMFIRQGWADLGWIDRFIKPVSAKGLQSRHHALLTSLAGRLSGPTDMALRLVDDWVGLQRSSKNVEIVRLSRFLPEHDEVLARLSADGLALRRSAEYLNWRYFGSVVEGHYAVFAVLDGGRFAGYAAVAVAMRGGVKMLALTELQARRGHMGMLLRRCIGHARAERVDSIFYQGLNPDLHPELKRVLFVKREPGSRFMLFTRHHDLRSTLTDRTRWRLNLGDSDGDFGLVFN